MALWVCAGTGGCGTKYAVGLFRCPRCHNTTFHEDGDPMAKITRHSGASDKTLPTPEASAAAEPEPTPAAAADQTEDGPREDPGTGEPMQAVDGDELTGDGSGRALPPVPDEAYGPDAVPLEEGGEESSLGSSSSASTETQPTSSEPSSKPSPKRARTTGSRSGKGQTASSSADGTAGGQETDTSTADSTK